MRLIKNIVVSIFPDPIPLDTDILRSFQMDVCLCLISQALGEAFQFWFLMVLTTGKFFFTQSLID